MKKLMLALCLSLPLTAIGAERFMKVDRDSTEAYFTVKVKDKGTIRGTWLGWCADWGRLIEDGVKYRAKFYSSYSSSFPQGLIDHPEHLDEMNWVLNQHFVGHESKTGLGAFTIGDVQLAIWTLLDDNFQTTTVGEFSQARVDEIVQLAYEEGSDFSPGCKQDVGIILEPKERQSGERVQTTIIEVPIGHFPKCAVPEEGLL
jgi:hypothetical protein